MNIILVSVLVSTALGANHYRFDCKKEGDGGGNIGNIRCNTTVRSPISYKKESYILEVNSCVNNPSYYNDDTMNCKVVSETTGDHKLARISCPSHIQSESIVSECRVFDVSSRTQGTAIWVTNRVKADGDEYTQCTKRPRFSFLPAYLSIYQYFSCIEVSREANCYTYAFFYPNQLYCEFLHVQEWNLDY